VKCKDCKYWYEKHWQCRRSAPSGLQIKAWYPKEKKWVNLPFDYSGLKPCYYGNWPFVLPDDFPCGEFKETEE